MAANGRYFIVQALTGVRVALAAGAAALLTVCPLASAGAWVAVAMLTAVELTDFFDGRLARRFGVGSRFGELFDPYCDSISRLIVFYGLARADLVPLWLLLLLALRDVTVAYIRIMCLHRGRKVAARASGKIKAVVQGGGAIVLAVMFAWPVLPLVAGEALRHAAVVCIAAVTAWSAVDYFVAAAGDGKQ
jgi:CDP-diacylglycerol--glycerol-3-phosphate 3-phosphatidyltransferase